MITRNCSLKSSQDFLFICWAIWNAMATITVFQLYPCRVVSPSWLYYNSGWGGCEFGAESEQFSLFWIIPKARLTVQSKVLTHSVHRKLKSIKVSEGNTSGTTKRLHFNFSLSCIGEGNGNSLQCSCLENPRDGGAWWAAVYGVAQSRTWLKRLSSSSSSKGEQRNGMIFRKRSQVEIFLFLIMKKMVACLSTNGMIK